MVNKIWGNSVKYLLSETSIDIRCIEWWLSAFGDIWRQKRKTQTQPRRDADNASFKLWIALKPGHNPRIG